MIILDDGYQHLGLVRDANILLLPAYRLFGSGGLVPAGTLREPKDQVRRADLVLVTHAEMVGEEEQPALAATVRALHPGVPLFFSRHEPRGLWRFPGGTPEPLSGLSGKRVLAFCGLAQPESFFFSLQSAGARVIRRTTFRDHHGYRRSEVEDLEREAAALQADAAVTTEKDALKIGRWVGAGPPLLVLAIQAVVPDQAFWDGLEEIIERD